MTTGFKVGRWAAGAILAIVLLFGSPALAAIACPEGQRPFASMYGDPTPFNEAIAKADAAAPPAATKLSGITVPHHLLVANLIALGFREASGAKYRRIVILSPDHFRRAEKPFAVAGRGFSTVFRPVSVDAAAVRQILGNGQVEESCLFAAEHGVQAMLPFVQHYFPGVPVVGIAVATRATRADWDSLAATLRPIVDDGTLLVQSTDFSHFLPAFLSRRFDQQTLNVLASGSPDLLAGLNQPGHVDSVGAFYVEHALEDARGASPVVVANENSQKYFARRLTSTTSYMVILWGRFSPGGAPEPVGASSVFLAGDTSFARAMAAVLQGEAAADRVEAAVRSVTRGGPLVVNLEGVILPNVPEGIGGMTLAMPAELAIPWLKRLNVVGVGLANNHAMDLGASGLAETRTALDAAGIASAAQGEALQLPGLDIVALSDLDNNRPKGVDLLTPALLDRLWRDGEPKAVAALVHWGREWDAAPGAREQALAEEMARRGAAVIAGAHPHVASQGLQALDGGDALLSFSLGNFLFDQRADRGASGAMLELTVFGQGTVFARRLPIPDLFDLGRE